MCNQEDDTSMIDLPLDKYAPIDGNSVIIDGKSTPYSDCGEPMGTVERLNAHNRTCAYCGPRNSDARTTGKGW